MNLNLTIIN